MLQRGGSIANLGIALLLLISFATVAIPSHAADNRSQQIDGIFSSFNTNDTPGAAVMVLDHDRVVFQRGYGLADLKTRARITPLTNFRLASVTKQFTATAILLLVHDGKLKLDENLTRIFPDFPPYGRKITVRNLLNHTSGLLDYEDLLDKQYPNTPPDKIPQIRDAGVLKLMEQQTTTQFEPGSRWQYSNSGYAVLAMIAERVSGKPFEDFLRERIFLPLHMRRTIAYVKGKNEVPDRAYGYTKSTQTGQWEMTDQSPTSAVLGDGGVYSSLRDLSHWLRAIEHHRLLPASELEQAYTPVKLPPGEKVSLPEDSKSISPPQGYGFGWFLGKYKGHRQIWHYGSTVGFRTAVQRFPDDHLAVVVLCNSSDANPEALSLQIADLYLKANSTTEH